MRVLNADAAKRLHEENGSTVLSVPADTFITRGARRYMDEQGLSLQQEKRERRGCAESADETAHREKTGKRQMEKGERRNEIGEQCYETAKQCDKTGKLNETEQEQFKETARRDETEAEKKARTKPEHLTSLFGAELVVKNHPRIVLRGRLDSFQGKVLEAQVSAAANGDGALKEELQEVLDYCRAILCAEVMDTPLTDTKLLGMTEAELRYVSQHPDEKFGVGHIAPTVEMGEICVALNSLRAQSREVELAAINAFCKPVQQTEKSADENGSGRSFEMETPGSLTECIVERVDILRALNRLSSALYIIYCRQLQKRLKTGQYTGRRSQ